MSSITLYHGSDHIIDKPLFGKAKIKNDYGLGFYCTKSKDLASEWAVASERDGYANEYSLDVSQLKVLNLHTIEYPVLTWLTILVQNRVFDSHSQVEIASKRFMIDNFSLDCSKYDLIKGYRADDSYFQFARAFLSGSIPYDTLVYSMHLGHLGDQYVLKSEKAFSSIRFVKSHLANAEIWFPKKVKKEDYARNLYASSISRLDIKDNDILIGDIIRGRLSDEEDLLLRKGLPSSCPGSSRSGN